MRIRNLKILDTLVKWKPMADVLLLLVLGLVTGCMTGLLGIGGGVITVPTLLFISPLVGGPLYPVAVATGLAACVGLSGGMASFTTHLRSHTLPIKWAISLGLGTLIGAIVGGWLSPYVWCVYNYLIFIVFLLTSLWMSWRSSTQPTPAESDVTALPFNGFVRFLLGATIGFVSAQVGIGGAVLLQAILLYTTHISLRTVIGASSLFVVLTCLGTLIGKQFSLHIPLTDALLLMLSASLGGYIGARLSQHIRMQLLRSILNGIILLTLIRLTIEIIREIRAVL